MSSPSTEAPVLVPCRTCHLTYNQTKNPNGCPYCAQNPNLGKLVEQRRAEAASKAVSPLRLWALLCVGYLLLNVAIGLGLYTDFLGIDPGDRGGKFIGILSVTTAVPLLVLAALLFSEVALTMVLVVVFSLLDTLVAGCTGVVLSSQPALYAAGLKLTTFVLFLRLWLNSRD